MKIRLPGLVLTVAVCLFASPSAFAWGCRGHEAIGLIAKKHLTPAAKALADKFLAIDPGRTKAPFGVCSTAGLDPYASGATWADAVRNRDGVADGGWHFVDIPRGGDRSTISPLCAQSPSCVIDAINHQMGILKDSSKTDQERAAAVRYILHFAGDIHQPLHCTTNGDKGANCVPLTYFKSKPKPRKDDNGVIIPDTYTVELHGIWDKEMVEKDMKANNVTTSQAYADFLDAAFTSEFSMWQAEPINPEDWAWDSHEHAEDIAYGDLPKLIPIDPHPDAVVKVCSDNSRIGNRMFHKHLKVGQPYQDDASDVIRERLAMAGIRLAMLLNKAAENLH